MQSIRFYLNLKCLLISRFFMAKMPNGLMLLILVFNEELKEPTLELIVFVVVAIEPLKELTDADIEELNVEYPVVPVMLTCIEPETTDSESNLFLIVVSIELVNKFNELVELSIDESLVNVLELNVLREPDEVSNEFNLPVALDVKLFKLPVVVSNAPTLPLFEDVYELKLLLIEELADSNEVSLPDALDVNELKVVLIEPLSVSKLPILPFCVLSSVAIYE